MAECQSNETETTHKQKQHCAIVNPANMADNDEQYEMPIPSLEQHVESLERHSDTTDSTSQPETEKSSNTERGHSNSGGDGESLLRDRLEDLAVNDESEGEDSDGSYHSFTNQEAEDMLREAESEAKDAFAREKEGANTKLSEDSFPDDFQAEMGDAGDAESEKEEEEDESARQKEEEALSVEEKEERKQKSQKLKDKGNQLFREASYSEAITCYTQALEVCPLVYHKERAIMFSNRAACRMKEEKYVTAIKDSSKAIELNPHYMKAIVRRAELYEKTEKLDEALKDHQRVLELDPGQYASRAACLRLDEEIKERNEKLKNEMLGKLKELGNMVLRPFGLSTNNFKLQQDPSSGSYSVQFSQTPPTNGK